MRQKTATSGKFSDVTDQSSNPPNSGLTAHPVSPRTRGVPLRPTTIRFSDPIYEFVSREAAAAGESVAEFVREAALARAAAFYVRRDGPALDELFELYAAAKAFDQRYAAEDEPTV